MRKTILLLFATSFCFTACKKDQKSSPIAPPMGVKIYETKFNVSGFTQQITTGLKKASVNANGLASAVDNLYYFVYDSNGLLIHRIYQQSDAANFGTIADSLATGTYTVIFTAGKTGINVVQPSGAGSSLQEGFIGGYGSQNPPLPWDDTFFNKFTLTVNNSNINQDVNLKRIVGQLTVNLEDLLPANVDNVVVTISQEYLRYSFTLAQPTSAFSNYTSKVAVPATAIGHTNFKLSKTLINTITPFSVTITCNDASGKVLATTLVDNVSLVPNTQTILSGKIFGSSNGFSLSLNKEWDASPIIIHF